MGGPVSVGNVVREFNIGATHIRICDDYCRDKTKAEVDAILRRISNIALDDFRSAVARRSRVER